MGCWNETDALTQLPILPGDPVKLVVVTAHSDEATFARCFPISGIYNDYGCITNIEEDWATDAFLAYCNNMMETNKWMIAKEEKERVELFDIKFPSSTIEAFLKAIEREFIVSAEWGSADPVFFVMIHDDLYAKAISLSGSYKEYHEESLLEKIHKRTQFMHSALDKELAERATEIDNEEVSTQMAPTLCTSFLSDFLFDEVLGMFKGNYIKVVYGDSCFGGRLESDKKTLPNDYIQRLLKLACLDYFLILTRKKFYKQSGSGRQDDEFALPALFFDHARLFAMKKYAEQEECKDDE